MVSDAMRALAECCRHGDGVEMDEAEAERWEAADTVAVEARGEVCKHVTYF